MLEWAVVDDEVRERIRKNGAAELKPTKSMREFAEELLKLKVTDEAELDRAIGS